MLLVNATLYIFNVIDGAFILTTEPYVPVPFLIVNLLIFTVKFGFVTSNKLVFSLL